MPIADGDDKDDGIALMMGSGMEIPPVAAPTAALTHGCGIGTCLRPYRLPPSPSRFPGPALHLFFAFDD